jgi:hypothetical protein
MQNVIPKEKRWPVIIFSILFTTICVNVAFAYFAISDHGGGFELMNQDNSPSSYKMKYAIDPQESEE